MVGGMCNTNALKLGQNRSPALAGSRSRCKTQCMLPKRNPAGQERKKGANLRRSSCGFAARSVEYMRRQEDAGSTSIEDTADAMIIRPNSPSWFSAYRPWPSA